MQDQPEPRPLPHCGAARNDYVCTLDRGHDGPHQAADSDDVICASWPQDGAR